MEEKKPWTKGQQCLPFEYIFDIAFLKQQKEEEDEMIRIRTSPAGKRYFDKIKRQEQVLCLV